MGKIFTKLSHADFRHQAEVNERKAKQARRQAQLDQEREQARKVAEERLASQRVVELARVGTNVAVELPLRRSHCVSRVVLPASEIHCSINTHGSVLEVMPDFGARLERFVRAKIERPVRVYVSSGPAIKPALMNRPLTADDIVQYIVEESLAYLEQEPRAKLRVVWRMMNIGEEDMGLVETNIRAVAVFFVDRNGFLHHEWAALSADVSVTSELLRECTYTSRATEAQKRRLNLIARAINDGYKRLYRSLLSTYASLQLT